MPSIRKEMARYINADVVKDAPIESEIDRVERQEISDSSRHVLFVKGEDRGLPLNVTNTDILCEAFGEDYDEWPGRKVVLFKDRTQFKGKMVNCVRIRIPE